MRFLITLAVAAILPGCLSSCNTLTPEERSALVKFGLETATLIRDAKLLPDKPAK